MSEGLPDVAGDAAATVAGKANVCPHCRGQTRVEKDPVYRWVCGACGGPRVPVKDLRAHTPHIDRLLERAQLERKRGLGKRVWSMLLAVLGAVLAAVASGIGGTAGVVLLVLALPLLAVAVLAGLGARRSRAAAARASLEAWEALAERTLALHGGKSAGEMAELMGTDENEAERVMTVLAVEDRVRVDVGDDAQVRYSTEALDEVAEQAAHEAGKVSR